jgi:hypothetical protein
MGPDELQPPKEDAEMRKREKRKEEGLMSSGAGSPSQPSLESY